MTASFPDAEDSFVDNQVEEQMAVIREVITAIRNIRGEMNVPPAVQVEATIFGPDTLTGLLELYGDYVSDLANLSTLGVGRDGEPPRMAASAVIGELEVFVPLKGVLDVKEESSRLQKEISKLESELDRTRKKLANNDFLTRAPEDIVAKQRDKFVRLGGKLEKLLTQLNTLMKLSAEG